MVRLLRIAAGVVALLACDARPAEAALVAVGVLSNVDELATRDTTTGLEWLDVSATKGLSVNDVLAGARLYGDVPSWLELGFRYATRDEVCGLFTPRTGPFFGCGGQDPGVPDAAMVELQSLLGITSESDGLRATEGYFGSGYAGVGRRIDGSSAGAGVTSNFYPEEKIPTFGSWLVRVPEPPVLLVLCFLAVVIPGLRAPGATP